MKDCTIIIFGATGDLSRKKLIPSLYHLDADKRLGDNTKIICMGRREMPQQDWLDNVVEYVTPKARGGVDQAILENFLSRISYFKCEINEASDYETLNTMLYDEANAFPKNIVFYLSIGPSLFGTVGDQLAAVDLNKEDDGFRHLVVEKPFGYDEASANELEGVLRRNFSEAQTYRIDHYLGKETVQNIFALRFANAFLEPLWNSDHIDLVQVTHAEQQGVGGRAGYYDGSGALRDMIQSHLLQVMSLVAMEPPANLTDESVRDEKVKVLSAIRPITEADVDDIAFRGQYSAGQVNGEQILGYLEDPDVPDDSVTETYAAMKVYIDNWRWKGVPFYLRTGKAMPESKVTIAARLKKPAIDLLGNAEANWISISIQPSNSISIELQTKQPGLELTSRTITMATADTAKAELKIDAYEAMILNATLGDRSLFLRSDEVKQAWKAVDPILAKWSKDKTKVASYEPGTWGPEEGSKIFDDPSHAWRNDF